MMKDECWQALADGSFIIHHCALIISEAYRRKPVVTCITAAAAPSL